MRTTLVALAIFGVAACGEKTSNDTDSATTGTADTDADTDSDSDIDTDTDSDSDTDGDADVDTGNSDTGTGTGIGTGRTPGCAPVWPVTLPDDSSCTSNMSETDLYNGGPPYYFVVDTYDATGTLTSEALNDTQQGYRLDELHTFTTDPVTGQVTEDDVDLGQDGSVDLVIAYTYTYDASNNVTHAQIDTTDVASGTVTTELVDQTFGTCGLESQLWDNDGNGTVDDTYTVTYFTDGWERDTDIGTDGVVDNHEDFYADAATGQPLSYDENYDPAHPGVDLTYDWQAFGPDNQQLSVTGIDSVDVGMGNYLDLDLAVDWTYDANGHETAYEVTLSYAGYGVLYDVLDATTWNCTP